MNRWSWNELEEEALQGLPLRAQIIYLRGLRRFMDYATGVVGIKRGISYGSLAETSETRRTAGSTIQEDLPSRKAVRIAVEQLEKAGLIVRHSLGRKLIFLMPMADTDKTVESSKGRGRAEEGQISKGRLKPQQNAASEQMKGRGGADPTPQRRGIPPNTDIRSTTTACAKREAIAQPEQPTKPKEVKDVSSNEFVFPSGLSTKQVSKIQTSLRAVSTEEAQEVLDVLAAGLKAKNIPSPVGFSLAMIKSVQAGTFNAQPGRAIAQSRTEVFTGKAQLANTTPEDHRSTDDILSIHNRYLTSNKPKKTVSRPSRLRGGDSS